jgi:hypothetical protein
VILSNLIALPKPGECSVIGTILINLLAIRSNFAVPKCSRSFRNTFPLPQRSYSATILQYSESQCVSQNGAPCAGIYSSKLLPLYMGYAIWHPHSHQLTHKSVCLSRRSMQSTLRLSRVPVVTTLSTLTIQGPLCIRICRKHGIWRLLDCSLLIVEIVMENRVRSFCCCSNTELTTPMNNRDRSCTFEILSGYGLTLLLKVFRFQTPLGAGHCGGKEGRDRIAKSQCSSNMQRWAESPLPIYETANELVKGYFVLSYCLAAVE